MDILHALSSKRSEGPFAVSHNGPSDHYALKNIRSEGPYILNRRSEGPSGRGPKDRYSAFGLEINKKKNE